MLNGLLLGSQLAHKGICEDPFSGQALLNVTLVEPLHNLTTPPIVRLWQHHNYKSNLSDGNLYELCSASHTQKLGPLFLEAVIRFGKLYVEVTHSESGADVTQYFSHRGVVGRTHFWDLQISKLPTIQYETSKNGGYITLTWGKITFLPEAFKDNSGNQISPPSTIEIKATWGARDDRATNVLEGNAVLRSLTENGFEYELFEREFKEQALEEGMGTSDSLLITAITANGAKLTITTGKTHGYSLFDEVLLQPVSNIAAAIFMGKYEVSEIVNSTQFEVTSTATGSYTNGDLECSREILPIPLYLGYTNHPSLIRTGVETEWRYYRPDFVGTAPSGVTLFDDGIDITSTGWGADSLGNRYLERGGTQTFGLATAAGTGAVTTLSQLFSWGATKLGLTFSDLDSSDQIAIDQVITSQITIIDLLDQVAGYCNFAFYIKNDTLVLFDRAIAHGDIGPIGEIDIFKVHYSVPMPVKQYKAKWEVAFAGSQYKDGNTGLPAILQKKKESTEKGTHSLGQEKLIKVFNEKENLVKLRLKAKKAAHEQTEIQIEAPLERLPQFGETLTYLDQDFDPPLAMEAKVTSFELDFGSDQLTIKARGAFL
ncbi:MAG: hypothetical protein QNL04_10865 [SAR324 cluster bacterium]|nr:hypothetical protein [SAR324 cluster bacterium]